MNQNPFRPECFTNINRMNKEFEIYCNGIIDMFLPRRTRHRQSLPVWYTSDTANLLKRVETQRRLYQSKPTSYRKQKLSEMEKLLLEEAERNKSEYQYKVFSSRRTNFLFKHFKSMNKNAGIPEVLRFGTVEAKTMQQKANLLNEYFQSVYSQPCKVSTRQTSEVTEGLVTNFSVSNIEKLTEIPWSSTSITGFQVWITGENKRWIIECLIPQPLPPPACETAPPQPNCAWYGKFLTLHKSYKLSQFTI